MHLDHIQLAMPPGQEPAARVFFGAMLGMTEETKPPPLDARGGCWFRSAAGAIVHIGVEADFRPQKKAHPAFVVADVDALAEHLAAAGHPVQWDESLPSRRRFYTADPFGNRIEFMADGAGFGQRP